MDAFKIELEYGQLLGMLRSGNGGGGAGGGGGGSGIPWSVAGWQQASCKFLQAPQLH